MKKIQKNKLALNSESIKQLDDVQLANAAGGGMNPTITNCLGRQSCTCYTVRC